VGIVVWWAVLLGIVAGVMPLARVSRHSLILLGVLGALVALNLLATLTWTESAERSLVEVGRLLTLTGVFVLMLLVQGRQGLRMALYALAAAVAVIAVVALADRFERGLFQFRASDSLPPGYPVARLNHPLEYWNALAALMAIGVPALLAIASRARPAGAAAAAAALPLVALVVYMTASRGGLAAAAAAVLVMLTLYPERLRLILASAVPVIGAVLLVIAVDAHPATRDALPGPEAESQGTTMFWICVGVGVAAAALQAGVARLLERGTVPSVPSKVTRTFGAALAAVMAVAVVLAFASGFVSDRWSEFKQPATGGTVERLASVSSSERYFNWKAAVDAASSEKLTGIGPGTFEYFWAREGEGEQFVRDAHSLYLEQLAETGPLGLLIILGLVLTPIVLAGAGAIRSGSVEKRALLAASAAGMVAFAAAAAVDWAWEMTVLPVAFLVLAAASLGPGGTGEPADRKGLSLAARLAAVAVCLIAAAVIALPMISTLDYRSSQELVRQGDLEGALAEAESAADLQPWAASPRVQEAQVLLLLGQTRQAIESAREAVDLERGSWRNWYVLYQALSDVSPARARLAIERARSLNPRAPDQRADARSFGSGPQESSP
jgi:hypothetical protein